MKSTNKFHRMQKGIHKMNKKQEGMKQKQNIHNLKDCVSIPTDYDNKKLISSTQKFLNCFDRQEKRNEIDESNYQLKKLKSQSEYKKNKQFTYDSFYINDRITKLKLCFKEVNKHSSLNIKPCQNLNNKTYRNSKSKISEQIRIKQSSSLQTYKNTKRFQMNALKVHIYQKKQALNRQKQNKLFNKRLNRTSFIFKKCHNIVNQSYLQHSIKKNQTRSFIDFTIDQINKNQLRKLFTKSHKHKNISQEVINLNQQRSYIKTFHNDDTVKRIINIKQRQNTAISLDRQYQFKKNDQYANKKNDQSNIYQQLNKEPHKLVCRDYNKRYKKLNKKSSTIDINISQHNTQQNKSATYINDDVKQQKMDVQFYNNMISYARNQISNSCQFLIKPTIKKYTSQMMRKQRPILFTRYNVIQNDSQKQQDNQNLYKNDDILQENKQNLIRLKNNQSQQNTQVIDLKQFVFKKQQQSSLLKDIKGHISSKQNKQVEKIDNSKKVTKTESIIYLIKNNFIVNAEIQIKTNPDAYLQLDSKNNNIFHIAICYQRLEILQMLLNKLSFNHSRFLLLQKNRNKRTPQNLAKMWSYSKALVIIQKFWKNNSYNELIRGYLKGQKLENQKIQHNQQKY